MAFVSLWPRESALHSILDEGFSRPGLAFPKADMNKSRSEEVVLPKLGFTRYSRCWRFRLVFFSFVLGVLRMHEVFSGILEVHSSPPYVEGCGTRVMGRHFFPSAPVVRGFLDAIIV